MRYAIRTADMENARLVGNEMEALYTNGPAGGGGLNKRITEIISICSIFVPRDLIRPQVIVKEVLL